MQIALSSGHGKFVRGASSDMLDEVDEARQVVDRVASLLRQDGVEVATFHDNTSQAKFENLEAIVDFHNAQTRDLDVSVHFNAHHATERPMGTECLYVTQDDLADAVAAKIAAASGLQNRGAKHRGDLFFLNETEKPAILIEVCFVDSSADAARYGDSFDAICIAIAQALARAKV